MAILTPPNVGNGNNSLVSQDTTMTLQQKRKLDEEEFYKFRKNLLSNYTHLEEDTYKKLYKLSGWQQEKLAKEREKLLEEYFEKYKDEQKALQKANEEHSKKINQENFRQMESERDEKVRNLKEAYATERKMAKAKAIDDRKKYKAEIKWQGKASRDYSKKKYKEEKAEQRRQIKDYTQQLDKDLRKQGLRGKDLLQAKAQAGVGSAYTAESVRAGIEKSINGLFNNWSSVFENTIQSYQNYQAKINTRLQGSNYRWQGSGGIEDVITKTVGVTPWVKLQDVMDNVVKATEQGIAFNVEQRAFLHTISDNIATTFNAFDSNLSRIIRIQQADSTAARLGMEASLTSYLNAMFEDSSYMSNTYDTVYANLIDATSSMTAEAGAAFEYMVQKWLGSMESVGVSSSTITNIASAINAMASGDISGLRGGMQNLMVMASSRLKGAGYADFLTQGLNDSNVNTLLQSMVEYLQEIASSTNNKVVKSQYAEIFGVTVSDLNAIKNLIGTTNDIASKSLSYSGALAELESQFGQMSSRLSIGNMLQNLKDNAKYSIAASIAGNPALYSLWEITSMIEGLTGGIALPTISTFGNMIDLNTTVTNLMRTGIVGAGTLGAIGDIVSGLSNTVDPKKILSKFGMVGSNAKTTTRGSGLNKRLKTLNQLSASSYVGTSSAEDYYNETMLQADKTVAEYKNANMSNEITLSNIHEYLLRIFDPKITAIQKYFAKLIGSEVETSAFGSFTNSDNVTYNATMVKVIDEEESKTTRIENIENNTSSILALLDSVISGGAMRVSNINESSPGY